MTTRAKATSCPNFNDYKKYEPTKSCYLDGKYFNKVFSKHPGLIKTPLVIDLDATSHQVGMPLALYDLNQESLLRIVIQTPKSRHDTAAVLNHKNKTAYWFEPFPNEASKPLSNLIAQYLGYNVMQVPHSAPNVTNAKCDESGFCTAYTIKYLHDYIHNQPVDLTKIKSFASRVQREYPTLTGAPDVSFGPFDFLSSGSPNQGRNALIGGLGGAAVGGLLGGGVGGALLGGGIGALGGALLTGPGRPFQ